jgi:hypothetical protein
MALTRPHGYWLTSEKGESDERRMMTVGKKREVGRSGLYNTL